MPVVDFVSRLTYILAGILIRDPLQIYECNRKPKGLIYSISLVARKSSILLAKNLGEDAGCKS